MSEIPPPIPGPEDYYFTVVLSGGLALGSYFAGAVAQLGYFVTHWNAQAEKDGRPHVYVDMVSGASAGALTGATLVHYLAAGSRDPEEFVKKNFTTWCGPRLSADKLLATRGNSFLSSKEIEELAQEVLPSNADLGLAYGQERLVFVCTMTSMTPTLFDVNMPRSWVGDSGSRKAGLPMEGATRRDWISFRFQPVGDVDKRFIKKGEDGKTSIESLHFQEREWVALEAASWPSSSSEGADSKLMFWERFRWAAMTSAAFPLAWDPVRFWRRGTFYQPPTRNESGSYEFTYMDGGIIDNMPLGRAANILSHIALQTADGDGLTSRRGYVLIDPGGASRSTEAVFAGRRVKGPQRTSEPLTHIGGPLFEALREQSFWHDLSRAKDVNEQIATFKKVYAPMLVQSVAAGAYDGTALKDLKHQALKMFAAQVNDKEGRLQNLLRHIESWPVFAGLTGDTLEKAKVVVVMAQIAADLDGKHEMTILRITPGDDATLKSAFLGAFGGFASQHYMADDFALGLHDAEASLRKFIADTPFAESVSFFGADQVATLRSEVLAHVPAPGPEGGLEGLGTFRREQLQKALLRRAFAYIQMQFPNLLPYLLKRVALAVGILAILIGILALSHGPLKDLLGWIFLIGGAILALTGFGDGFLKAAQTWFARLGQGVKAGMASFKHSTKQPPNP